MNVRRLALGALLGATLLLALFTSPLTKGLFQKKPPGASAPSQAPVLTQAPSPPAPAPKLSQEELAVWRARFAQAWKRDPFFTAEEEQALRASDGVRAPARPGAPLPSYTVKVVLISETSRVAAINGQLVNEGEMLGEERVVEILPDGVVLERAGQRRRVEVSGGGAIPLVEVGPSPRQKSANR